MMPIITKFNHFIHILIDLTWYNRVGDNMIKKMTKEYAEEIVSWQYEKPYDVYNMPNAFEVLMESYQVIVKDELIGFFCSGFDAQVPPGNYPEGYLDFGIGMKPELCGQHLGPEFMKEVIDALGEPLRLTVYTWNERAINLYKNLGFSEVERFYRGGREFLIMTQ